MGPLVSSWLEEDAAHVGKEGANVQPDSRDETQFHPAEPYGSRTLSVLGCQALSAATYFSSVISTNSEVTTHEKAHNAARIDITPPWTFNFVLANSNHI